MYIHNLNKMVNKNKKISMLIVVFILSFFSVNAFTLTDSEGWNIDTQQVVFFPDSDFYYGNGGQLNGYNSNVGSNSDCDMIEMMGFNPTPEIGDTICVYLYSNSQIYEFTVLDTQFGNYVELAEAEPPEPFVGYCNGSLSITTPSGSNNTIMIEPTCTDIIVNQEAGATLNLMYSNKTEHLNQSRTITLNSLEIDGSISSIDGFYLNSYIDNLIIETSPIMRSIDIYGTGNNNITIKNYDSGYLSFMKLKDLNTFNVSGNKSTHNYKSINSGYVVNVKNIIMKNFIFYTNNVYFNYNPFGIVKVNSYSFDFPFTTINSAYENTLSTILFNNNIEVPDELVDGNMLMYNFAPNTNLQTNTSFGNNDGYSIYTGENSLTFGNYSYIDNSFKLYEDTFFTMNFNSEKEFGLNKFQFMKFENKTDFENKFNLSTSLLNIELYTIINGTNVGNMWLDKNGEDLYECLNETTTLLYEGKEIIVCNEPVMIDNTFIDYIIIQPQEQQEEPETPSSGGSSGGSSYQPATDDMDNTIEEVKNIPIQAFSLFNEDGDLDLSQIESISTKTSIPYSDVIVGGISLGGIGYAMRKVKFTKGNSKKAKKNNRWIKFGLNLVASGFIYSILLVLANTLL